MKGRERVGRLGWVEKVEKVGNVGGEGGGKSVREQRLEYSPSE